MTVEPISDTEEAPEATEAPTPRRRGRPRDVTIDEAVLAATLDLIAQVGVVGLSMDQVAQRAGVGKATIYRRWDSKETLLLDALRAAVNPTPLPDTGGLRGDLDEFLHGVIVRYRNNPWPDVLPHLIEAGHYDPALRAEVDQHLRDRQQTLRTILQRAIDRGDLNVVAHVGVDVLVSAVLGPLIYRMMLTHEPLDETFVNGLLDVLPTS